MSYITCLCGERSPTSRYPDPQSATVIPSMVNDGLFDKLEDLYEKAGELSKSQLMKTLGLLLTHISTPGILAIYECHACKRIALFARASDSYAMFWYQRESSDAPESVNSMQDLVEELQKGHMPVGWQNPAYRKDSSEI